MLPSPSNPLSVVRELEREYTREDGLPIRLNGSTGLVEILDLREVHTAPPGLVRALKDPRCPPSHAVAGRGLVDRSRSDDERTARLA